MTEMLTVDPELGLVVLPVEPPPDDYIRLSRSALELNFGPGLYAALLDIGLEVVCTAHDLNTVSIRHRPYQVGNV